MIEQLLVLLAQRDQRVEAFFFRTSDQHEIDLVLDFGDRLWAIEIKLTSAPGPGDMRRLNSAADLLGADRRILISQTRRAVSGKREISCSLPWFARHVMTGIRRT